MTIELRVRRASNVFTDHEVLRLQPDAMTVGLQLAGAAWLAIGAPPQSAHRSSIGEVTSLIMSRFAGYVIWLLAAHSTWQSDSRITRHRKLWGSLKARGVAKPAGDEVAETMIEGDQGIRFFGALRLGPGAIDAAVAVLEAEPVSHMVALKLHDDVVPRGLVASGWGRLGEQRPSTRVLSAVCPAEGIVLSLVGAFDDRECGCAAIANTDAIDCLCSDLPQGV